MTAFPPGRLHCRQTDGSHQEYQTMRRAERFFALLALFMRYRLRRANRLLPQTPPPSIPVEFSAMKKDPAQRRVFFWCGRQELNLHGVNHKILSLARLPVPPRPHLADSFVIVPQTKSKVKFFHRKFRNFSEILQLFLYIPPSRDTGSSEGRCHPQKSRNFSAMNVPFPPPRCMRRAQFRVR